jgi:hypothetical protein
MAISKNGHANSLKYIFQTNLILSLPTTQIGVCTPLPLREKAFAPTSNGLTRIVYLNCFFLSLPIRTSASPTKT